MDVLALTAGVTALNSFSHPKRRTPNVDSYPVPEIRDGKFYDTLYKDQLVKKMPLNNYRRGSEIGNPSYLNPRPVNVTMEDAGSYLGNLGFGGFPNTKLLQRLHAERVNVCFNQWENPRFWAYNRVEPNSKGWRKYNGIYDTVDFS